MEEKITQLDKNSRTGFRIVESDDALVGLFEARDEMAILRTEEVFGRYLDSVSYNILGDIEDARECTNDTLLRAWNHIPPDHPNNFKAYLARISRNLALDRYDRRNAEKRGGGAVNAVLEELEECVSDDTNAKAVTTSKLPGPDRALEFAELTDAINAYLAGIDQKKRTMFVRRYFYLDSIDTISKDLLISKSNVKTTLFRIREGLKAYLKQEGLL